MDDEKLFCSTCLKDLSLIEPKGRCPYCFGEWNGSNMSLCSTCRRHPPILDGLAAACEGMGPAATLLNRLKYGDRPYLAQGAAALMAAQFIQLEWPFPDLIVPVPISFSHWFERGYNQSQLLADAFGKIIDRPVQNLIKSKFGECGFKLATGKDATYKVILLIDDVVKTGNTLRQCVDLLEEIHPKAIYGLVFCKS